MTNPQQLEKVAREAAEEAAKILVEFNEKRNFEISFKGDVNLVTDADIASEAAVLKILRSNFPDHIIVSEENEKSHERSMNGPVWIIDPLDGTTNFSHGFPYFGISIAYREKGQTIFGLIYQPMLRELFIAHRGQGATLNGESIRVSKINEINKSLLATGFPYDRRESDQNNLREFCEMELAAQCVRRPGAATLDLAYIACGRLDGYWEPKLSAWDVAAGALLVEEAGGTVTDFKNQPITNLWNREIVATNGLIHTNMVNMLNDSRKRPLRF